MMTYQAMPWAPLALRGASIADEVVVMDGSWLDWNGRNEPSSDGTREAVRFMMERLGKPWKLLDAAGLQSACRTAAVQACSGDVILVCDADEILPREGWEHVIELMRSRPDVGALWLPARVFWLDGAWYHPHGQCMVAMRSHGGLRAVWQRDHVTVGEKFYAGNPIVNHMSYVGRARFKEKNNWHRNTHGPERTLTAPHADALERDYLRAYDDPTPENVAALAATFAALQGIPSYEIVPYRGILPLEIKSALGELK